MATSSSESVATGGADATVGDQHQRRLRWTDPMVAALLELRLGTLCELFKRSRSSPQRREAWAELAAKFRFQMRSAPLGVLQLKNKFNALRREYVALELAARSQKQQEQRGEDEGKQAADTIEFPTYWTMLKRYFQGIVYIPDETVESLPMHSSSETSLPVVQSNAKPPAARANGGSSGCDLVTGTTATTSTREQLPTPIPSPTSSASSLLKSRRLQWSNDMITTLLELRLWTLGDAFEDSSKSSTRLRELWTQLRLKFSLKHDVNVEMLQLKNKYNALRREYFTMDATTVEKHHHQQQQPGGESARRGAQDGSGSGDNELSTPSLPLYWPILVTFFGGLQDKKDDNIGALAMTEAAMDRAYPSRKRRLSNTARPTDSRPPPPPQAVSCEEDNSPAVARALAPVSSVPNALGGPSNGQKDGDGTTKTLATLLKLTERLSEQQQAMQQQLDRQHAQLERMMTQSTVVNAALLQFLRREGILTSDATTAITSATSPSNGSTDSVRTEDVE